MAQQNLNTGAIANDNTGDLLRDAFIKTQSNFTELYSKDSDLSLNKQDKEVGKGLSTNDYTNVDKTKVDNLPADTAGELALKLGTTGGVMTGTLQTCNAILSAPTQSFDFETGSFPAGGSTFGDANWVVNNLDANTGTYSAKSGAITALQSTTYQQIVTVSNSNSVISFAYKIDSEGTAAEPYDPLEFYINDRLQQVFAGNEGWASSAIVYIPQGTVTLKWIFKNDTATTVGLNYCRIDDITIRDFTPSLDAKGITKLGDTVVTGNIFFDGSLIGDVAFLQDIKVGPSGATGALPITMGSGKGHRNTILGQSPLASLAEKQTNQGNIAIGWTPSSGLTDSVSSVFVGDNTSQHLTNSSNSVFIGREAGYNITQATNSVVLLPKDTAVNFPPSTVLNKRMILGATDTPFVDCDGITGTHKLPSITDVGIELGGATSMVSKGYADKYYKLENQVIVRTAADLPAPIMAPDGVMRHPLAHSTNYLFIGLPIGAGGKSTIFLTNPILFPSYPGLASTNIQTNAAFVDIVYLGTDTLFYGIDCSRIYINGPNIIMANFGTRLFDLTGNFPNDPNSVPFLEVNLSGIVQANLGRVSNFNYVVLGRFTLIACAGPLELYNVIIFYLKEFNIVANVGIGSPFIIITGIIDRISIVDAPLSSIVSGESFIAIDSGLSFNSITIEKAVFSGVVGTNFIQPNLTGSITQYQNLATLISGTCTSFVNDGFGEVLVTTSVPHGCYVGLKQTYSGTTNYNGVHTVTKIMSTTTFVISAAYVAIETTGTYVGYGTRVTSAAHKMTNFRTTTISGSTHYDGALVIRNVTANTFDIQNLFVANTASGTFLTTSLDKTNPRIVSKDNGFYPDSETYAQTTRPRATPITVTVSAANTPYLIGGTNWVSDFNERFTITTGGRVTYTGINPVTLTVSMIATISKVGGGTNAISIRLLKNGVNVPTSESSSTTVATPTDVSGETLINLVTGDYLELAVINYTSATNILVDFAKLAVK